MAGRSGSTRAPGPWKPGPPFPRGNKLSVIHGASSDRAIEARAAEVRAHIFEAAPWLAEQPAYMPAIARYLRAEARELLIHEHILKVAEDKGTGAVPQRLWEQATAAANAAMKAGALLGLDPQSLARLRAVTGHAELTAHTLEDVKNEGRRARAIDAEAVDEEDDPA